MNHTLGRHLALTAAIALLCLAQWGCSAKNDAMPSAAQDYAARADWYPLRPDYRPAAQRLFDAYFTDNENASYRVVVDPLEPEAIVTERGRFRWRGKAAVLRTSHIRECGNSEHLYYYYILREGLHIEKVNNSALEVGKTVLAFATLGLVEYVHDAFVPELREVNEIKERAKEADANPGRDWRRPGSPTGAGTVDSIANRP
ncbi:MAG: hypothetical protein Q4F72_09950 [Desulfovibrionaceae bacterium]|nr:hypothetical protein [Desulfovibrionaceae bacterium]